MNRFLIAGLAGLVLLVAPAPAPAGSGRVTLFCRKCNDCRLYCSGLPAANDSRKNCNIKCDKQYCQKCLL
jgi:hypothetical protein